MTQPNFSPTEQANQVAEAMQLSVIEKHGILAQKGLYALIVLMVVFVIWACLAESDVCAEATGLIEPRTKVQHLKPLSDGTIQEYLIVDGQTVKQGQLLITLNTVRAEAELKKKEQELAILQTQLKQHLSASAGLAGILKDPQAKPQGSLALPEVDRIAGELYASKQALDAARFDASSNGLSRTPSDSSEMAVFTAQQKQLESVRQAKSLSIQKRAVERVAQKKKLESLLRSKEAGLQKSRVQLTELEASLADTHKEMDIYEQGKRLGVASEVKYLDVQNYLHQREFSVAQQKQQIAQLEQAVQQARLDLEASALAYEADQADMKAGVKSEEMRIASVPLSMNDTMKTLQHSQAEFAVASYNAHSRFSKERAEISSLERKIAETITTVNVLKEELAEKEIRSPIDGTVSDLQHLMPGEMVARGQLLLSVVPSDSALVLRAEVNNTDVGFMELGQQARLRVEAFPCEEFGVLQGKIVRIGDYPEEKVEGQKKVSVYRVTIEPLQTAIQSNGKRLELKPGLQVHADVVLRKRSLLGLLFEPLLKMGN